MILIILFISSFEIKNVNPFDTLTTNGFMILIILFISSFEIKNVNPFDTLTTPFALIFLSNLFLAFQAKLLANPVKLPLAKRITTFVSAFW